MTRAGFRRSLLESNDGPYEQEGRSTTIILSREANLSAIPHQFARNYIRLKSNRELREILCSISDGTLAFYGRWRELTAGVQYALAAWTVGGPGRASAVFPVDLNAEPDNGITRRWLTRPDIVLVQPTGNFLVRGGTVRRCTDLEALNLARDERSPTALAITGHGAEHAVQFGSFWLCTDPHARLSGPIIDPRDLRSPLVFLNSCASLRMGGSTVPISHSLAATLYAQGSVVVGTFRNLHATLDLPRLFVEGLTSGEALGSVLRNVNAAAMRNGAVIPPYQIMGDPTIKVSALPVQLNRSNDMNIRAARTVADNIVSAELLVRTITSWFEPSDAMETSHKRFKSIARCILALCHDDVFQSLSPQEIDDTLQMGRDAAAAMRATLLDELRDKIQEIRWLEICYAPVSQSRVSRQVGAGPKSSLIVRHIYRPMDPGLLAVTKEDCCDRGTLSEWLGRRAGGRIRVRLSAAAIAIDASALAENELGVFFIHRTKAAPVIPWPRDGGHVSFAIDDLPFKGRVIVVAARLGANFVHFEYRTLFVPGNAPDDTADLPVITSVESN